MIGLTRPFTRRVLLGSVFRLGSGLALISPLPAGAGRRRDRGIGGTGVIIEQPPEDRGIGGTGVIGTIREFGSIVVNDMHIAYPADAEVEIDGRRASPADLRLGQVVQVVAEPDAAGFATQRINISNEVVGPIESVEKGALTVLGQRVLTPYIGDKGWQKGDWIAVSGLRNFDGAIVASLAQYHDGSVARVVGPVRLSPEGAPRIGGLPLANLDPSLAGRRVLAEVGRDNGAPVALKSVADPELAAMPGVRQLSVETYVARSRGAVHFGSGIVVSTRSGSSLNTSSAAALGSQAPVRAIVAVAVNPDDGGMTATGQKPAPAPKPAQPNLEPPKPVHAAQPNKGKVSAPAEKNKAPAGKPLEMHEAAPAKTVAKPASAETKPVVNKVETPKPAPGHAAPPPPAYTAPPHAAPPSPIHVAPPTPVHVAPPTPVHVAPPPPVHFEPPHYEPNIRHK